MSQVIVFIQLLFFVAACYRQPSAKMTDKYIEIVKPGQICGLVELKQVTIDSILGYPIKEEDGVAYSIVERSSKKPINSNGELKIYFREKHGKYIWKIWDGPFASDFHFADTIVLKPDTWYRLSTERYRFKVYYFWDTITGNYVIKIKPNPGAY